MRTVRRGRAGFTLVELWIALTVMLVAVLATLVTQVSVSQLVRQSRETERACADLAAAMEAVLLLPPDQIPQAGRFPPGVPIAAFTNKSFSVQTIVPSYPGYTGGDPPDPLPIVLTQTFLDGGGRQRVLRLISMRTR